MCKVTNAFKTPRGYRELVKGEPLTKVYDRTTRRPADVVGWDRDGQLLVRQGELEYATPAVWFVAPK